ncbi:MAG: hypothetical protein KDI65_10055 [Alphaproteobacteria bacterium]|nr:hypothetical protein [Alphaproteobacteria bacterium]
MRSFSSASDPSPDQLRQACVGPYRDFMVFLGILNQKQSDLITERQQVMSAVSRSINEGVPPSEELMDSENEIDLMKIADLDQVALMKVIGEAGITQEKLEDARRDLAQGVPELDITQNYYPAPRIGKIQSHMLGRPDLVQAVLTLQQSVRAADICYRLQNGDASPEESYQRLEFRFYDPDEDERLQDATELHYQLCKIERDAAQPGEPYDTSLYHEALQKSFMDAVTMFDAAATGADYGGVSPILTKISDRVTTLAQYCLDRIHADVPITINPSAEREEVDPLTDLDFLRRDGNS